MKIDRKNLFIYLAPFVIFGLIVIYSVIANSTLTTKSISGGCLDKKISFIKYKKSDTYHKITFCDNGEKDLYKIETPYVKNSKFISFDYIGNPKGNNISIYLEDEHSNRYYVKNLHVRGVGWTNTILKIPNTLKGKIKMVAEDKSSNKDGWVGVGNIVFSDSFTSIYSSVYLKTVIYILIFSFLVSSLTLLFYKKSILNAYIQMSLFLGLYSLVVFFIGLKYVVAIKYLSIAIFLISIYKIIKINCKTLNIFLTIFSLISLLMIIVIFMGFSDIDSLNNMQSVSANRWHHLPVDNWIPKFFADGILRGHVPSPLFGQWLSSDRPPLQTGFFLIFTLFSDSNLMYLVSGVGMQLLIVGLIFLFILKYIKDSRYISLFMLLVFLNGFVFVHSLFVWPKMLSALYQGIAFYYLYIIWLNKSRANINYILFGLATILAFLSHGGSVFYLLGIYLLLLIYILKEKYIKGLFYSIITAILVYLPWVYYQKVIDPPGDRLLKWHLAAQVDITKDSFFNVLVKYYSNMSLDYWINLQLSHIKRIFYSFYLQLPNIQNLTHGKFLNDAYFNLDYSLLFFSIFLLPLYFITKKRVEPNIKLLLNLMIFSYFIYIIIWSLLLASGTVLHQGAYFPWFVGLFTISYIVYRFNKYLFYILGALNLLIFIIVYFKPYIFNRDILVGLIIIYAILSYIYLIYRTIQNRNNYELQ